MHRKVLADTIGTRDCLFLKTIRNKASSGAVKRLIGGDSPRQKGSTKVQGE